MTAITLTQASADLLVNVQLNVPTLIVGPVGVGKTDLVKQIANILRSSAYGSLRVLVIDKRASQMEPTDIALPMPDIATRTVIACLQEWLPNAVLAAQYDIIIILLDEYTDAPLGVQAALNQLVLDRALPGYTLPDNVRIIGTGNRAADKANAQKISRASANRFAIMEIGIDVQAWIAWAMANGIDPMLVAFIQDAERQGKGTEILHAYPVAGNDAIAFMTPRSYSRCDKYLKMAAIPNDNQLRRLFAQNIGEASANALLTFMSIYRLAPNVDKIIADPKNATIPREPSVNFIIGVGLVSRLTLANIGAIATYIKRNEPLYQASFWSLAKEKDKDASTGKSVYEKTAEYVAFLISQSNDDSDIAA